eukprot:1018254-Rhodomonas_salina.2
MALWEGNLQIFQREHSVPANWESSHRTECGSQHPFRISTERATPRYEEQTEREFPAWLSGGRSLCSFLRSEQYFDAKTGPEPREKGGGPLPVSSRCGLSRKRWERGGGGGRQAEEDQGDGGWMLRYILVL